MAERNKHNIVTKHLVAILGTFWFTFYLFSAITYFANIPLLLPEILFHIGNVFGVSLILQYIIQKKLTEEMRQEQIAGDIVMLAKEFPSDVKYKLVDRVLRIVSDDYGKDADDLYEALTTVVEPEGIFVYLRRENTIGENEGSPRLKPWGILSVNWRKNLA